jgi:glycosyltransferase involved in cell wall biosynthesis
MVSVLILTKNEEQDLPSCLDSVAWSNDVHVFDSFSSDATPEIARSRGAHLTQRAFDTYAAQRNAALDTLPFKHNWIFLLDADERPTAELSSEIQQVAANAPIDVNAYRLRRRDFFQGSWLRHAQLSPFYVRLVQRGKARYTRDVNEVLEIDGTVAELASPLDHYPFSKGITHWLKKHNTYATMEAELIAAGITKNDSSLKAALWGNDFHTRRVAQKALFYRMPARPLIKWCYMMFVRGAILDGSAGIAYTNLQAIYEYFIVLKTRELLKSKSRQESPDASQS